MKCYFCQTEYKAPNHGFICTTCPREVFNTTTSWGTNLLVCIYEGPYTVGLSIEDQSCFILEKETQKYLLTLDYIPDINPTNVEQYIHKLLKLKAFI